MQHIKTTSSKKFGDANNYVRLDKTGVLLAGDAKYKRRIRIPITATGKAAEAPTTVYAGNFVGYRFAINDEVYFTSEIVQRWDEIANIDMLVNWCINEVYATNSGKVQWEMSWSAVPGNGTEGINAPAHSGVLVTGDINIGTVLYGNLKSNFSTNLPAANLNQEDLLGFKLKRIAVGSDNNPTAHPIILQTEMIITLNKLGQAI